MKILKKNKKKPWISVSAVIRVSSSYLLLCFC